MIFICQYCTLISEWGCGQESVVAFKSCVYIVVTMIKRSSTVE